MAKEFPNAGQPQPQNKRSPDFESLYSNNFAFESSVWDFKIIFGELDQTLGVIEQHTAMTLPWSGVKLLIYYLETNVAEKLRFLAQLSRPNPRRFPRSIRTIPSSKRCMKNSGNYTRNFWQACHLPR
jgi:hypothetical protein